MALVNFSNLDFDQIKTSIKSYLRSNSNFTDYDFEGSNLSTIIDILAYNTYISSYNANMVSNEVFIDSATLRENVVSLARNIGYIPRSRRASVANISFFVDTTTIASNPLSLTLQKGIVCTSSSSFGADSYTFTIQDNITVNVVNGIASFNNFEVNEGTYLRQSFTVDANNPNQRFILNNANIDSKTIRVSVRNTQQSTVTRKFTLSENLIDVTSSSLVFFIQEIEDQRYELIFGDDVFGKKLDNNNFIEVSYVVTNGEAANRVSGFTFNGRILDNNGSIVTTGISLITTDAAAQGGAEIESINSIKNYAPRIYSSQNRAVTATDYEAIIPTLYPETESISVFGGETLNPPKYGKVFIAIKPFNGAFVPNIIKDNLKSKLRKYSIAGIVPEIVDLKYLYVEYDVTAYVNSNLSPGASTVKSIISSNIEQYANSTELNKYGARFKYSKFLKIIDDGHPSITSNITKVVMRRDLKAIANKIADYEICYGNEFHITDIKNGYNVKSTGFNINGITDTLYLSDKPDSNGQTGSIFFFKLKSPTEPIVISNNVGTIDYKKGEIKLRGINLTNSLKVVEGIPYIQISIAPQSNDVIGKEDLYLQLDINNSVTNILDDSISSGADISGSTYTTTSSYSNGTYVRL